MTKAQRYGRLTSRHLLLSILDNLLKQRCRDAVKELILNARRALLVVEDDIYYFPLLVEFLCSKEINNTLCCWGTRERGCSLKEVEDKDYLLVEQNKEVVKLQEQASLKLDEVKTIIEELKGLIVNA